MKGRKIMLSDISCCNKCNLCNNQKPLLDKKVDSDVMWVGLSAKSVDDVLTEIPLSGDTKTGCLISELERGIDSVEFYKTNLVKCLPLDENGKLRYPTVEEMEICFSNLACEIEEMKPKIVFLLGNNVVSIVKKHYKFQFDKLLNYEYNHYKFDDINFVPIHHPSYISVYKRKFVNQYINGVKNVIESLAH